MASETNLQYGASMREPDERWEGSNVSERKLCQEMVSYTMNKGTAKELKACHHSTITGKWANTRERRVDYQTT